jgi:hypothetical protein
MLLGQDYVKDIITYLSWLSQQVAEHNKLNLTDMNVGAEDFFRGLLNLVFGYQLENLNDIDPNATAVDLGDKTSRIAIQVTSTSTLKKTTKTVEKFAEKGLGKDYDRLIILNIVKKSHHKQEHILAAGCSLDTKSDIWDKSDLIAKIKMLSTEEKKAVLDYLKAEMKLGQPQSVPKEVATILNLIEYISDDDHPAAGTGFIEEPFPDDKVNKRFADHADYLRGRFQDLYPEYGMVLKTVREQADFGSVRVRRAADFLRDYSDKVLTSCGGDPKKAMDQIVAELTGLLAERGQEYDAGAVQFYVIEELTRCNVFPNEKVANAGPAVQG